MEVRLVWKEEREKAIFSMGGLLKFITCGSVDDGKSTLIGHMLYDAKLLYADQERALELESKLGSMGGEIDYSLLLDGLIAEREQGITIDVAYRYFATENRSFIVADTPGHEEYTRNMAVGASFAELAIILVDASQGILIQTKRHARICSLMGIRHFVFAVNKMDLVYYSQKEFEKIEKEINEFARKLDLRDITVIPVSATNGDNVTNRLNNMNWYKGKTLIEYLETVDVDDALMEEGLVLPVQRVCRPDYSFRGFQGQVESGCLCIGVAMELFEEYQKQLENSWILFDDVVDMLHSLEGYRLGIISNGKSIQQRAKLSCTNIEKYFEIILISEETGFAKPSVDIFYEAVKQSGEKIDSVIYVGDNIKTDILPCEKIGMKCVLVDRNSICEKNICKIKNLYEIHNVLLNDIGQYNTELSIRSSAQ